MLVYLNQRLCPNLHHTISLVSKLGLQRLGHPLRPVRTLVGRLQPAGGDPEEVVGAKVVDLVEEQVESVTVSNQNSAPQKRHTHEFSFSSSSNMRL